MKKYRIISMVLATVMTLSLTTPAFAAEASIDAPIPPAISEQETPISGVVIERLDNATYYLENTESYTVAIGLYDNFADCSIRDLETNTINSAIVPMEQIDSVLPQVQTRSRDTAAQFEAIKDAILDGTLTLPELTLQTPSTPAPRVTSSEKDKIMTELYNAGWPKSYANYLRASLTRNGVTAKLYHTLPYFNLQYPGL